VDLGSALSGPRRRAARWWHDGYAGAYGRQQQLAEQRRRQNGRYKDAAKLERASVSAPPSGHGARGAWLRTRD